MENPWEKRMDVVFDVDGTLMNIEHRVKYARRNLPELDALKLALNFTSNPIPNPDYDYERFESEIVNDTPNIEIFAVAHALREQGHTIIIASGRKRKWAKTTLRMLDEYYIWCEHFLRRGSRDAHYFRKDGDNRKDSIVKEEMYEQMLEDGYDPKLVFDDRQQVVDMWRSKGIRVCQVDVGNF